MALVQELSNGTDSKSKHTSDNHEFWPEIVQVTKKLAAGIIYYVLRYITLFRVFVFVGVQYDTVSFLNTTDVVQDYAQP